VSDVKTDPATRVAEPERLSARMASVMSRVDRARARRDLPPAQVLVQAPGFQFASGERARRFHAASVAKSMTATLAFGLVERGKLDLDAPITRVLPAEDRQRLFVRAGHDHARHVTIRHLLTHTSGAADYFGGRVVSGPPFSRLLETEPDRLWTAADLLQFSRDHQRPVGEPGARFSYSDTGFVLLGRVIEEAGAATLGAQLHERILRPAGMDHSCLLFHTLPGGAASTATHPAVDLDIAPLYLGHHELSRARSLSCDWGGGGVVTTLDDLSRFWAAWTDGRLVGEASRAAMADAAHRFRPGIRYGAGAMRLHYSGFSPFLTRMPRPVGHLGVTSAHAFTVPEVGIRVVLNFHATGAMVQSFRTHIELMRMLVRALGR
jgi:D-alanyl-D-alanine carboxypeptidase